MLHCANALTVVKKPPKVPHAFTAPHDGAGNCDVEAEIIVADGSKALHIPQKG